MLHICYSECLWEPLQYTVATGLLPGDKAVLFAPDLSIGNISHVSIPPSGKESACFGLRWRSHTGFCRELPRHSEFILWYHLNAKELCGLAYTLWMLRQQSALVSVVFCGEGEEERKDEIAPASINQYFLSRELLQQRQMRRLSNLWERLTQENGTLRVLRNRTLETADVSYYDAVILSFIPASPVPVSKIVTNMMRWGKIKINSALIAERIRVMIGTGRLCAKGKSTHFYEMQVWKS